MRRIPIILCFLSIFFHSSIVLAALSSTPYSDSAHGNTSYGVLRTGITDIYSYKRGNCAHCHEQHASIGGSEPTPVDGPDDFLLFTGTDTGASSQTVNTCFDCHQFGGVINDNYAANFGGESPVVFSNIADAFASLGSAHNLSSISTEIQSNFTSPSGVIPSGANPCSGCHNPHLAQKNNNTGGSYDPSMAAISIPTAHNDLWGDDAAERMDQYASSNGGIYRAPFFYSDTLDPLLLSNPHEPDGISRTYLSNEVQGSTTPDYNTFCLSCHSSTIGTTAAIDFSSTGDVHGGGNADLAGNRGFRVAPYRTDGTNSGGLDFPNYILSCLDCHEPHGSNNIFLLRSMINGMKITTTITDSATSGVLCTPCHVVNAHADQFCLRCHYHGDTGGRF